MSEFREVHGPAMYDSDFLLLPLWMITGFDPMDSIHFNKYLLSIYYVPSNVREQSSE